MLKQRILTGWTFTRALYVLLGTFIIVQSGIHHDWIGVIFGTYFASMGVFSFGCAAGGCFTGNCAPQTTTESSKAIDTEFEEVKAK